MESPRNQISRSATLSLLRQETPCRGGGVPSGQWIASNACLPRWTAARMASADLVQTNGLGLSLVSAMKRLIAACSSTIDVKTPRLSRCRVSLANRPSTALAQEHEVGVKWKVKR